MMHSREMAFLLVASTSMASSGCDKFDAPPTASSVASAQASASDGRARVRDALTETMKAAETLTATCVAADLRWEADVSDTNIPTHFSRPCIPERCAPSAADVEALRSSVGRARKLIDQDPLLQAPSTKGFVALSEAMIGFVDTELASAKSLTTAPDPSGAKLSGLSMHYTAMATAFRGLYPEPSVPLEPPSLAASLAVASPGGDLCKGWGTAHDCDVTAIRVPKERRWRAVPACIEVDSVMKQKP